MPARPSPSVPSSSVHASDLDLVRRTLAREPAAIDAFMQRMRCVATFVVAGNVRRGRPLDADAVHDVVQEVVGRVWRKLADYGGSAQLESWVYRFCDFELCNAIRRAGTRRTEPLRAEVVDPRDGDRYDGTELVQVTLAALPPLDARILRLKIFAAMTFAAIAVQVTRSPNTVKTRYYRALQLLRRRMRAPAPHARSAHQRGCCA